MPMPAPYPDHRARARATDVTRESRTAASRAAATLRAIRRSRMFGKRHRLYGRRRWPCRRSYEDLWPFANAWSAVTTLATLPDGPDVSAALGQFVDGARAYSRSRDLLAGTGPVGFESSVVPPLGDGGDRYYDDNAWVALALLRHEDLVHSPPLAALARRLLSFVISGWSTESDWRHPGGIRWKEPASNRSRNTCSNAPAAELAALVHERTGDREALEWALRIYDWVRRALLGPGDLYVDRISPDGVRDPALWTYNQGSMIGAGALLHRITGDPGYLVHAAATASAARQRFTLDALLAQDAAFNAVYFRNLLLLGRTAPDPGHVASAAAYGDAMWERARNRATGLFPRGSSPLNDTAPMIEIYALVAGADPNA